MLISFIILFQKHTGFNKSHKEKQEPRRVSDKPSKLETVHLYSSCIREAHGTTVEGVQSMEPFPNDITKVHCESV